MNPATTHTAVFIATLAITALPLHAADESASHAAVAALKTYLAPADQRQPLDQQPFAATPLTKADAQAAQDLLWQDHVASIQQSRAAEVKARLLTDPANPRVF